MIALGYNNIEELKNNPPSEYRAIGHETDSIAWMYYNNELLCGNSHSQLIRNIGLKTQAERDEFGEFFSNQCWHGRFDAGQNVISISYGLHLSFHKSTPQIPTDLLITLKNKYKELFNKEPIGAIYFGQKNEILADTRDFIKTANDSSEDFFQTIADTDRYTTDRYGLSITLRNTKQGHAIGLQIVNAQIGLAGYVQYWFYKENEKQKANQTLSQLKKICSKLVKELEFDMVPMAVINSMLRASIDKVDISHKEKSGVQVYNWYISDVENAPDWRETLYGKRYPNNIVSNLSKLINNEEKSKNLTTNGTGRNTMYKYKFAELDKVNLDIQKWMYDKWQQLKLPISFTAFFSAALMLAPSQAEVTKLTDQQLASTVSQKLKSPEQTQTTRQTQTTQPIHNMDERNTRGQVNISDWISRIAKQESGDNPRCKDSPVGARGRLQIMPATWKEWTQNIFGKSLPFEQAYDGKLNTQVATTYLKWIQTTLREWMKREPGIEHILAAYNGGIGALRRNNYNVSKMPTETRNYVKSITGMQVDQNNNVIKKKKQAQIENSVNNNIKEHETLLLELIAKYGEHWNKIAKELLQHGVSSQEMSHLNELFLNMIIAKSNTPKLEKWSFIFSSVQ